MRIISTDLSMPIDTINHFFFRAEEVLKDGGRDLFQYAGETYHIKRIGDNFYLRKGGVAGLSLVGTDKNGATTK